MASIEAVMEVLASGQVECCMCGDYGLLNQLFQCKVCLFRSQHRYCSNLYPKNNESFRVCNWCLKKEKENTEGTTTTSSTVSSSSSSCNNSRDEFQHMNNSMKKSRSSTADKSMGRLQIQSVEIGNNNKEMKKQMFKGCKGGSRTLDMEQQDNWFKMGLIDLSSSWSNESTDQIQSNVTWSDHMTNANEDHLGSSDRGMINMSKEELKIRSELEMDIESDLEAEIKDGICHLALKLHRLYQHQRERIARELSTNGSQSGRKKSVLLTEMNILMRMEGGSKVEINEMKKQKDQPKPFPRYKQGKTFQIGKEFNWVRTLRSEAASSTNNAKKKHLKSQIHHVVKKNNISTVNEDQDREESKRSKNVLKKLTDEE
ncbi:Ubiquitin carboxyl-terminal hydrolase, partial [Thalictrum thalictroides]